MFDSQYQPRIESLLDKADIRVNGSRGWDLQVHNPAVFARIIGHGTIGLGEAYMDGWWDCQQMDELFSRLLSAQLKNHITTFADRFFYLQAHLRNRQKGSQSIDAIGQHYNVGNDLYRKMLGQEMIYTCGYWRNANNLDQAQKHKLELVCRKLNLQPGMRVLDIGCGWGGAARYMAKNHAVEVVGITISEDQLSLANNQSNNLATEYRLQDFRDIDEKFDRIYSLGMFEHVGFKNYRAYFEMIDRCLHDGGLFLLQTIGHRTTESKVDPWIDRYIFPSAILPSAELISRHSCDLLNLEDWQNFGLDYHRTLMAWYENIEPAWPKLENYDERFRRMWRYYLMCSAGTFKAYRNHLWQIVFSKGIQTSLYHPMRSAI